MNKIIPIFFTIDDNYAPYLSCAIQSIKANASIKYDYKLIILHENLSKENLKKLSELSDEKFEIQFREMKEGLETITDRVENRLRCDYFTLTIYYRLFIPDMFPEYDKGIYIDSDVIVPGDISEMYNIELGENLIGACQDHSIENIPELINYIENYIGIAGKEYINSGVLLMNLKALRENNFSKKFLELLNQFHFDSVAPDQDYINAMCNGKIYYLDEVWDAMPDNAKEPLPNPKLIHYNLFFKPWFYDNIQYENYFWKYARESSYYNDIVENKNNYTEEQKEQDGKTLAFLIHKGNILPEADVSFKKMCEKGGSIRV